MQTEQQRRTHTQSESDNRWGRIWPLNFLYTHFLPSISISFKPISVWSSKEKRNQGKHFHTKNRRPDRKSLASPKRFSQEKCCNHWCAQSHCLHWLSFILPVITFTSIKGMVWNNCKKDVSCGVQSIRRTETRNAVSMLEEGLPSALEALNHILLTSSDQHPVCSLFDLKSMSMKYTRVSRQKWVQSLSCRCIWVCG